MEPDALAAALAAGETPSAETVAASDWKKAFSRRAAVLCFLAVTASLVACSVWWARLTVPGTVPLSAPAGALALRAREMLAQLGYVVPPADSAYGFRYQGRMIRFWYREAPRELESEVFLTKDLASSVVTPNSPSNDVPGSILLELDSQGRLVFLRVTTAASARGAGPADWRAVLSAAGLDTAGPAAAAPEHIPPVFADQRAAWTSVAGRVEAAASGGRPVYFESFPAGTPSAGAGSPAGSAGPVAAVFALAVVLIAASIAAHRNLKLGRAHAGSLRICLVFFGMFMLHWVLVAHHVAGYGELYLMTMGLAWAAFIVGAFWVLYTAVEPLIRRSFPGALISWMRMVNGSWRDPVAASHILGGITVRMASLPLVLLARVATHAGPATPAIQTLAGFRDTFGYAIGSIEMGSATGLLTISMLLVLRRLIRRKGWPTVILILIGALAGPAAPAAYFAGALSTGLGIWMVNRFGWLALLAGNIALQVFLWTPINTGPGYALLWAPHLAVIVAGAGWALYAVLANRSYTKKLPILRNLA